MGHKFAEIAFTPAVRALQTRHGSRSGYARMETGADFNLALGPREAEFIAARDSFYMASVGETGWPYVQHRGGPPGFVRVLDERTLGFADFRGNRQYVSVGNFTNDDRVALIFMDYANRMRLKLFGRVRVVGLADAATLAKLDLEDYRAQVERGMLVTIEGFDWNCPQHITPRYSEPEIDALIEPLRAENARLNEMLAGSARAADVARADRSVQAGAGAPDSQHTIGNGPLPLVVAGLRRITPRVRSYRLEHAAGEALPAVTPGAHLTVPIALEDGTVSERSYSIAAAGSQREYYEIAVLREDDGRGGSSRLHGHWQLGTRIDTGLPENHFPMHEDARPAVLIAGGIGITPLKPMAERLYARGIEFVLHFAGRSRAELPYLLELERGLGSALRIHDASAGRRMDVEAALRAAPADAVFYVCGPARLIDAVLEAGASLGIARARLRFERFDSGLLADETAVDVTLERSGIEFHVEPDETILDAMLAAGVDAPYSCKAGNCRTCVVSVLAGEVDHRDAVLSRDERDNGLMCPCVSRSRGGHLVLDV